MLPFLVEFHQKIEAVVKHCLTPLELHHVALSRIMMLVGATDASTTTIDQKASLTNLVGPQPTPTNLPNPSELHHLLETV